ncbi:ribitol-5-phosphate transferase FKTN-like isoform X2 [Amphiura filiformis]|uniref:ribitol-5-phosphate transferase FKTN-like isoform X2 n=1 Tax=Amphiura filiformis TaxID=82378 RepID=UPI003B21F8E9
MHRSGILAGLLFISLCFLLVQVYLYAISLRSLKHQGFTRKISTKGLNAYKTTKEFLLIAAKYNTPLFVMDHDILEALVQYRVGPPGETNTTLGRCKYLCYNNSIRTFGVLDIRWITKGFLKDLKSSGFRSTLIVGPDPRHMSTQYLSPPNTPFHYLFESQYKTYIHLIVFYERRTSYLWHGPIQRTDLIEEPSGNWEPVWPLLQFGREFAGAYAKMEFTLIHVDRLNILVPKFPASFLNQVPQSQFIECNFRQAYNFAAVNGMDNSPEAKDFRVKAREVLVRGKRALDDIGVRFWLSSGTCLGWFRECNIIPHGLDVDFGIWITDYNSKIVSAMESHGLQLKLEFGKVEDSYELSFVRGNIKLDVFFFYEEYDHMWNGGTEYRNGNKYKYDFPKFTLCWTEFVGVRVRVPCETQSYIEANYGKDWDRKVKHWNWKESPPNVRPNGQWDAEEMQQVVKVF